LVIENGAYGQRMVKICRILNIPHDVISFNETEQAQIDKIADKLKSNEYTHVAIIHCETSSGILNPIEEIGQLVYDHGAKKGLTSIDLYIQSKDVFTLGSTVYIVDSMSAFGAIPVSLRNGHITYIISSANKCIEGIPGFGFVICKKQHLITCQG
jgi:2-aminoethylphosphonate-pyruvate transaminase